jgi:hypothetical protein
MKRQKIRVLQTIALAAGIAAGASTASAAGLLGQRYVSATLDYVNWDDEAFVDDGWGGSLVYNQPLNKSIDLSLNYSHLKSDAGEGHISADAFGFLGTWYTNAANGKLYLRGDIGWAKTSSNLVVFPIDSEGTTPPVAAQVPGGNGLFDDDFTFYALETGLELALGDKASITPFVAYAHPFHNNDGNGSWDFGVKSDYDITNSTSVLVSAAVDDDSNLQFSAGFVFRF